MVKVLKEFEEYLIQEQRWPQDGRHILAQSDAETIVVYQAFNSRIAQAAVQDQLFGGGGYSTSRMTWIKTNFLWMMYRCGWAQKDQNQERVLAIRLRRQAFEQLLLASWPSAYTSLAKELYSTKEEWKAAKASSGVVLQWDPDHTPDGLPHPERRAIQLGIRPNFVQSLFNTKECIVAIEDISDFVHVQRQHLQAGEALVLPRETVYEPERKLEVAKKIQPSILKVEDVGEEG